MRTFPEQNEVENTYDVQKSFTSREIQKQQIEQEFL